MRTTHRITTKHGSFIILVMVITWFDFEEVLLETFILANFFFFQFGMCFIKVKHYFGHISGMVGPIDVKQKGSASVGYWAQYVTLTFDLTHDLDLGCFKVKFRNSFFLWIVGLINVKWKRSEPVWPCWGVWIYRIVTGVTSDVGVPSTYLVLICFVMVAKCTNVFYYEANQADYRVV